MSDISEHCLCDHCSGKDCEIFSDEEIERDNKDHDLNIRKETLKEVIGILQEGIDGMPDFIIPEVKQGKIDAIEWAIERLETLF